MALRLGLFKRCSSAFHNYSDSYTERLYLFRCQSPYGWAVLAKWMRRSSDGLGLVRRKCRACDWSYLIIGAHAGRGSIVACRSSIAMPQDPIRIDQFWDKNPLVVPWMEQFLPANRMWQDAIATVFWIFIVACVGCALLHFVLPNNVVSGIMCVLPGGYLLGSLNKRMSRAQRKFFQAKRDEGRTPTASA
jgi:hypothetical protein